MQAKQNSWMYVYAAFAIALVAMLGSLYFSEIAKFPPCVLCWDQRIAIYPLVLILAVGILREDRFVTSYALPLSIVGALISIYHNLLYYKILPESIQPCILGVSCTTKYIEWFGFVTIPLLSLISFVAIIVLLLVYRRGQVSDPR